ncbi:glycosyltransferase family 4 protein [Alcaligenaceae bacterium]|nr:glycosyltransferase family 4 protein [Alcaligenaceae bacterium]
MQTDKRETHTSSVTPPPLPELQRLQNEVARLAADLRQTQLERDAANAELNRLLTSRSWAVTRPLRGGFTALRLARHALQRLRDAMHRNGGLLPAVRKLIDVVGTEGLSGLRRRLHQAPPAAPVTSAKQWFPIADFLTTIDRQPTDILVPKVLLISEPGGAFADAGDAAQLAEELAQLGVAFENLPWSQPDACLKALATSTAVIMLGVPTPPQATEIIKEAQRLRLPIYADADEPTPGTDIIKWDHHGHRQLMDSAATRRSRKPRILTVNIFYSPRSFGGATIIAEEVNRRLQADDLEISVFAALPTDTVPSYALRRYEVGEISVFGVGMPEALSPLQMFENPGMTAPFQQALEAIQPDLVHFHCVQGIGILPMEQCVTAGIPFVVTLHDAWWLCGRQFMVNRQGVYCNQHSIDLDICARCVDDAALNTYRSERLRQVLDKAQLLLTPSAYFADFYQANGFPAERVRVNRNGVRRPGVSVQRLPSRTPRFGYVGGNDAIKGVNSIITAFRGLPAEAAKLVVVDNTMNLGFSCYAPDRFKGLANVEVVPAYTQATIDEFFAGIDVLLFPTQAKESFGLVVREALARNVWVICSDAGGVVEDILPGENGLIIPMDDDGTALKRAVHDTLAHFRSQGAEYTPPQTRITWFEDQTTELATIYREVLNRTGTQLSG